MTAALAVPARRVYRTGRVFIVHREAREVWGEVWGAVRDQRTGRIDVWLAAATGGRQETWMAPHETRESGTRHGGAE